VRPAGAVLTARTSIVYTTTLMTTTKATAFRFTDEDLALLDAIQRHTGIRSRTETLRAVLRQYARSERIELGKPKRTARSKP
jgi:hypothetical protein